jgi:hypothetical protein
MLIHNTILLTLALLVAPSLLNAMNNESDPSIISATITATIYNRLNQSHLATHYEEHDYIPPVNTPWTEWACASHENSNFRSNCAISFRPIFNCPEKTAFQITCHITPPSDNDTESSPKKAIKHVIELQYNQEYTEDLSNLDPDKENPNSPFRNLTLVVKNTVE